MSSDNIFQWNQMLTTLSWAAIENCQIGIIILDHQSQVVLWNAWMVKYTQISVQMAKGQHLKTLFPKLTDSRIYQAIQTALTQRMSSVISQSLHGSPFPLYLPKQVGQKTKIQQKVTISPLDLTHSEFSTLIPKEWLLKPHFQYCLIQITDDSLVVKRENLLRTQAQQMQVLANEYHAKEVYLQAILDNALDAIITLTEQGLIEIFNPAAEKIFGLKAQEIIGQPIEQLLPELEIKKDTNWQNHLQIHSVKINGLCKEIIGQRQNKSTVFLDISISEMRINNEPKLIGIMRDITHRKQIEEALMREKERALVTLQSIGDAVVTTDAQGLVQYMNPVAEHLTGWHGQIAQGTGLSTVFQLHNVEGEAITDSLYNRCMQESRTVKITDHTRLINRHDEIYHIEGTLAPIQMSQKIIGIVIAFHDISKAYQMAHQLTYQATHDALTDLVNRVEFERRLNQLIHERSHSQFQHTLCYMDLDQFKVVNDTCGHVAGDELLRQVTALLKSKIRSTDTLARLGGDEFGLLLQGCSLEKAFEIAEGLRKTIGDYRFVWDQKTFSIGVSIGIVAINQQTTQVSSLLSAADTACYAAKDSGRNRIYVYQTDDDELTQRHGQMQWASKVTQAIEDKRFLLYCQPIIPLIQETLEKKNNPLHIELLVRMLGEKNSPLVPPMAFIPAAERYNMMSNIDRWVITQAFSSYAEAYLHHPHLQININVSSISLGDEYFLDFVHAKLKQYNIPAQVICFEITETAAITHLNKALNFINSLKSLGCYFALDDFGSGLSSFAYLKNLPVDYLKIDCSFVKDMLEDSVDCAMVESINKVGHVLGLKTIAECVENKNRLNKLKKMGVNYVQGYGIAKPTPFAEIERLIPPTLEMISVCD